MSFSDYVKGFGSEIVPVRKKKEYSKVQYTDSEKGKMLAMRVKSGSKKAYSTYKEKLQPEIKNFFSKPSGLMSSPNTKGKKQSKPQGLGGFGL